MGSPPIVRPAQAMGSYAVSFKRSALKKLKGFDDLWRVRVGDHRVIYGIDDGVLTVHVLEVVGRKDAY